MEGRRLFSGIVLPVRKLWKRPALLELLERRGLEGDSVLSKLLELRELLELPGIREVLEPPELREQMELRDLLERPGLSARHELLALLERMELRGQAKSVCLLEPLEMRELRELLERPERETKLIQIKDPSTFRTKPKGEGWATSLAWFIPRKYRNDIIGDILEDCAEMREASCTERRIKFHVLYQWLIAVITLVPTAVKTSITDILKQVISPPK